SCACRCATAASRISRPRARARPRSSRPRRAARPPSPRPADMSAPDILALRAASLRALGADDATTAELLPYGDSPLTSAPLAELLARARGDFELLARALAHRNEPAPVPPAMGACVVAGYNNWSRVRDERRRWAAARGGDSEAAWRVAFAELVPRRERYQDR